MRTFLVLTALTAVAAAGRPRESRGAIYNNFQVGGGGLGHYGQLDGGQVYDQPQYAPVSLGGHYGGGGIPSPVGYGYPGGLGDAGLGLVGGAGPIAQVSPFDYPETISKSVYVYSAPPDPFDNVQPQVIKKFPSQKRKHYQVVFINAPNPPLPVQHTVELPTPPELKTQVYVLVKKPQKAPPLRVIPAKVPVHKPEVYFIRYQNQKGFGGLPGGPGPIIGDGGDYGSGGGLVDAGPDGYGGGLVETGPPSYRAVDANKINYEPPVHSGYEGGNGGGYVEEPLPINGGYDTPAGDYGAPVAEYGPPVGGHGAPGQDYESPSGDYTSPAASYEAPSGSYGSRISNYESSSPSEGHKGHSGGSGDMYSDYSRLNALYSYAPKYSKRRMDSGKWRPMERDAGMSGI